MIRRIFNLQIKMGLLCIDTFWIGIYSWEKGYIIYIYIYIYIYTYRYIYILGVLNNLVILTVEGMEFLKRKCMILLLCQTWRMRLWMKEWYCSRFEKKKRFSFQRSRNHRIFVCRLKNRQRNEEGIEILTERNWYMQTRASNIDAFRWQNVFDSEKSFLFIKKEKLMLASIHEENLIYHVALFNPFSLIASYFEI